MNKIFTQLLETRNIKDDFLNPKYDSLIAPEKMPDISPAVERIKQAIKNEERVLIYGDYDVDGVTSSTLMEAALKLAGVKDIEIMLPDRFIDGYGMSPRLIDRAREDQISLVVTVDCGSRNHDIVKSLQDENIDVIITDHHECEDALPPAVAILNPHRKDFAGPEDLKTLAGVGVAFKLAQALAEEGLIPSGQEKWLLDLVLIGTLCDSMYMSQENRTLCYYGKIVLKKTRRRGLQEIIKNAEVKDITSEAIGFRIGPRLNAAGRLTTAETSLNLLRTSSATAAASLAGELEKLNRDRRSAQRAATKEISAKLKSAPLTNVIIESGPWHEGILGIVAGRLVEQYHRPAFVLAEVEGGVYKGSGRSFGEFNLADALMNVKDVILGGGGHAAAAGVKVAKENLTAFKEKLNGYYESLNLKNQDRFLKKSWDLEITNLSDFSLDLIEEMGELEPFAPGNEEPIFCLKGAYINDMKRMGADGTHLRLDLKAQDDKIIKSVAFSAPDPWFSLDDAIPHTFLIQPVLNDFRGVRSVEARLLDVLE